MSRVKRWLPGLLLVTPSIIAIAVFVYGMLGWNFKLAMTDRHDEISEGEFVGLTNFFSIWEQERWGISVRHAIVFTLVFVGGALVLGWLLAFLMEKGIRVRAASAPSTSSRWPSRSSPPESCGAG